MSTAVSAGAVREALLALPEGASHGVPPSPSHVYLPPSHVKALNPAVQLVTGMRGAGKTFWWSALQDGAVRQLVGRFVRLPPLNENTVVRTGFGPGPSPHEYPGADQLRRLMADFEPKSVWRTVLAWQFAREQGHPLGECDSWAARARYVVEKPDAVDRLFRERDAEFDWKGVYFLVLFDALDRCADDWKQMYRAIRGLLQAALELLSYRRLRVKIFLRSDQADRAQIADFPDASKVLYSTVNLNWPRRDLYGLLWHCLGNGPNGNVLRVFLGGGDWPSVFADKQRSFAVPRELVRDEDLLRETFHRIAGPSMGGNHRRGRPYTWVANHLEDADQRVSPRSFMSALRTAADDTSEQYPDHEYALHHDSIKRGVQAASRIRVRELQEDYPWVHAVMSALAGMVVPLEFEEVAQRWRDRGVLDELGRQVEQNEVKLPPSRLDAGAEGVRLDLESLGVLQRLLDDRVNIRDVYRVGYGLGRRGGVKPDRST